ncbi:MAG: L-lactate dehydrogenase [Desulfobulbaceae bacterium]|nr:L-lactate dehydrogenase [Desulfobulbaceae bacterium]
MKLGIVGSGFVGSAAAYAAVLRGTASEIVLVDINSQLAEAQAEDILHATPWTYQVKIAARDYSGLRGAQAVILACGVSQKEGETRLQLLERNVKVFEKVIPRVMENTPDAILVVASNPVDVITYLVTRIAKLPSERVIGSGTILDTARFRALLGEHLGVAPRSVHAYVLGEHGDSEILVWSSARVGGVPLVEFAEQAGRSISGQVKSAIDAGVRQAAYRIIKGKGSTYFGIGAALSRIIEAIRDDEGAVLSVASLSDQLKGMDEVCLSVPRIVGAQGVSTELWPALSNQEYEDLQKSADILRKAAGETGY